LGEYYALLDAATTDTGWFNSDSYNLRLDILERSWTPEQPLFVRDNTHLIPVPLYLLRILPEKARESIRLSRLARQNQLRQRKRTK
jgi:hypothetical protein